MKHKISQLETSNSGDYLSEVSELTEDPDFSASNISELTTPFFTLLNINCPSAVDLLDEYPHYTADSWSEVIEELSQKGIDRAGIGLLLSLYPVLAQAPIYSTLDLDTTDWLNSVADAISQVRDINPEIYSKGFVVSHEQIFNNLAKVGQKIFDYQSKYPDIVISDEIVRNPQKFMAIGRITLSREISDHPIDTILHGTKRDGELLVGHQRVMFVQRMKDIDPNDTEYKDCAKYVFDTLVYSDRFKALKIMGIGSADSNKWLDRLLDEQAGTLDPAGLARIACLYEIFDRNGLKVRNLINKNPDLIHNKGASLTYVGRKAGLSKAQVNRLRYRLDSGGVGSAVYNAWQRISQFEVDSKRAQCLKTKHPDAPVLFQETQLHLPHISWAILKEEHPRLSEYEQRTKTRILALQMTVGVNLANLIIEDNLSFLTVGRPTKIIECELPLNTDQQSELRRQLESRGKHVSRMIRTNDQVSEMQTAYEHGDQMLNQKVSCVEGLVIKHALAINSDALFKKSPKLFTYDNFEIMSMRMEALVNIVGNERAAEIIQDRPLYIATAQAVHHIRDLLGDDTATDLKVRLKQLSDSRHHRKASESKIA